MHIVHFYTHTLHVLTHRATNSHMWQSIKKYCIYRSEAQIHVKLSHSQITLALFPSRLLKPMDQFYSIQVASVPQPSHYASDRKWIRHPYRPLQFLYQEAASQQHWQWGLRPDRRHSGTNTHHPAGFCQWTCHCGWSGPGWEVCVAQQQSRWGERGLFGILHIKVCLFSY